MANNSIQTRFTETNYATKQEVIHELKTPLIDSFWKMIVSYRNGFAKPLGVYEIDRTPITYCLCPSIASKIDDGEAKLYSLNNKYSMISEEGNDRLLYRNDSLIAILKEIAKKNDLQVDENFLRMVISNHISNDDDSYKVLTRYNEAINVAKKYIDRHIDEDLLADLYATLSGTNEMVSLYRTEDYLSAANKVIIDRLYAAAPANLIPNLMSDFLTVLNGKDLQLVVKAGLAYYFIAYVKPFPDYNEEIAALLSKIVIAQSFENGEVAFSINIEKLFSDLNEKVVKVCGEVQKNNDFTYFLDMYMRLVNDAVDKEINRLNNLEALSLKKEYYKEDFEEAKKSPEYQESAIPEAYQEPVAEEKPAPVIETPVSPVSPAPIIQERNISGLAISSLPPVLDEKEAQRLEEHLLETDPELKHSQAYFYARHCTMGKRYTISQFKKEVGCAYETARTSMDSLAELGYYRQEMVKNKKVYTPIKRN